MPRYSYECEDCQEVFILHHLINDIIDECPRCCGVNIEKLLSSPIMIKKDKSSDTHVGQLTKEYIIANKEILDNQIKEAKEEEYEPS